MNAHFASLREEFPTLERQTYLITHSFGLCPRGTFEDLEAYRETLLRRPALFHEWLERLDEMRSLLGDLIGAPSGSIALRESASACHGTVLSSLQAPARNRLVASRLSFPSISYMVSAQSQRGFDVELVPSADGIHLDASAIIDRIDERTAAVFVPVVASFNGALIDFAAVVRAADAVGAIAVLDAYSALGVVPIDVSTLPPCVIIGGTMKWLSGGGTGLAFMYVHPELVTRLPPAYPAWLGDARFLEFAPDFVPAAGARRYEMGTPAIEPVYTARAGLRFALDEGVSSLRQRNTDQLELLAKRAREVGLESISPPDAGQRAGVLALRVSDAAHSVSWLRARGIEIDSRNSRAVRLGPHCCVTFDECERTIELLAEAQLGA